MQLSFGLKLKTDIAITQITLKTIQKVNNKGEIPNIN